MEFPYKDRTPPTDSALTMNTTKEALIINLHLMRKIKNLTLLQRSLPQEKI